MNGHLVILQVLFPLLAAPLCLLIRKPGLVWLFALAATSLSFIISLEVVNQTSLTGPLIYSLGGWHAPIGIEYRVDTLAAYLLLLVSGLSCVILLATKTSLDNELQSHKTRLFYVLFLLCLAGMLGIVATGDAFNLFIFLEISALSSYALIALGKDRRALTAALRYLLVGTLGATFVLIGIGLLYMLTGTLNMQDMAERLLALSDSRTLFTAFAFILVGVCLKLALFPLHWWLPNAYAFAPSMASVLLAATSTKVAIYILIRFIFTIFGQEFSFSTLPLQTLLMTLGLVGILAASTMAIYQNNVKHILAYSSVAQVAYIMLALSFNSVSGLTASLLHVFNHALMKGALFLSLAAVMYRTGGVQLRHFAGLGEHMPWTMAALVVGGLSLVGLPLTVGFVSKWYLLLASFETQAWLAIFVILFGSILAIIYLWRILEAAYFRKASIDGQRVKEAPMSLLVPIWLLTIANLYFGIRTDFTLSMSQQAAISLIQGSL